MLDDPLDIVSKPIGQPLQGKAREKMIKRKRVSPGDVLLVNDDSYFSLHKLTEQELLTLLEKLKHKYDHMG